MSSLWHRARSFAADEHGAAIVEYTILLGIVTVAIFIAIAAIATFIETRWNTLGSALP